MSNYRIPFNRPCFAGNEQEYIARAMAGGQISGDGAFTRKCHAFLEEHLGVRKALLTTSCTHALEMAALLLNVGAGDEVILPSFTFVSTANAFVLRGARPVFADIRPDTLNIDESQLEELVTSRTKAIVPVHYAGVGCEMDSILDAANRHGIAVVEDNAHGLFGRYKGKPLGSFGCMATQSFHETKNFTCGEGGALLINDPQLTERAEVIWEKGTNRKRFFRGHVDKYTWVDVGSSYLPSEILAAFLLAQFEERNRIQSKRQQVWDFYNQGLAEWAEAEGVVRPTIPAYCEQSFHLYYLVVPTEGFRVGLIEHLKQEGIMAIFHYQPLHLSEMGRRFGGVPGQCPVTEDLTSRILRLPFYNDLDEKDQKDVIRAVCSYRGSS